MAKFGFLIVLLKLGFYILAIFKVALSTEAERELITTLFSNYTKEVRPVEKHSDTLCLEFGISISQLHEVKEKDQVMKTSLWLEQNWTDLNLKWNPEDYENITSIRVPSEWLWLPDIVLYNNADGQYEVTLRTKALVRYSGQVEWTPPAIYKSSCEIDVQYFPFDMQTCKMKFGSWTYDAKLVDLYMRRKLVNLKGYWENGEWALVDAPGMKNVIKYNSCCGDTVYTDVTFFFVLRRKPLFYTVNLIIPCVLISFLTVLVFYLPSDCGEKITLCISVLLALTVFLLLIAEIIPATSLVVPLIGNYLLFTMVMVTLSIIITVIVLNVHHRAPSTHTMPHWVKRFFLVLLPKVLFMRRPNKEEDQLRNIGGLGGGDFITLSSGPPSPPIVHTTSEFLNHNASTGHNNNNTGDNGISRHSEHSDLLSASNCSHTGGAKRRLSKYSLRQEDFITEEDIRHGGNRGSTKSLSQEVKRAIDGVQYIAQHLRNEDEFNSVSEDWKYVAMVLDRLFLWVFVVICVVGTCSIILNAPLITNPPNGSYTGIKDEGAANAFGCGPGFW